MGVLSPTRSRSWRQRVPVRWQMPAAALLAIGTFAVASPGTAGALTFTSAQLPGSIRPLVVCVGRTLDTLLYGDPVFYSCRV